MKKRIIISALFLFSFIIYSCTGPAGPAGKDGSDGKDGQSDKQIRLEFPGYFSSHMADTNYLLCTWYKIVRFNISNYFDVDSVIFYASLSTSKGTVIGEVTLFNLTDSTIIESSELSTNKNDFEDVYSRNILSSLPNKDIDICFRVKIINPLDYFTIQHACLLIYRK